MRRAGEPTLQGLTRRWRRRLMWADALRGLAAALVGWAVVGRWTSESAALAAAAGLGAAVVLIGARARRRRTAPGMLARHLDRERPRLQESAELLLPSARELPPLARLQRHRAAAALAGEDPGELLPRAPVRRAMLAVAAALVVAVAVRLLPAAARPPEGPPAPPPPAARATVPSPSAVRLAAVTLEIRPPAYTGRPTRLTDRLSTEVEEGAEVIWRLEVEGEAERAEVVLDEERRVGLAADGRGGFAGGLRVEAPHLYRLRLEAGGREVYRGDYARLLLVRDRAPELELLRPERRRQLASPGQKGLAVRVRARDDHGVAETVLVATLAAGSGELVRFRERRLPLEKVAERRRDDGGTELDAVAQLDLEVLGMEPGTELYLFAEAFDHRRPRPNRGRSATHVVRMPGERAAAVDLGSGLPIFHLPELFRSQRQIILDTERLLADEPRISAAELARRSQALGFDQRALRMRYAGLLGEEFESGSPLDEESEEDGEFEFAEPGAVDGDISAALEQLPEGLTHSHDSAERNTYFEDEVRSRLKAAMQEMWDAEGRLRGMRPRLALPYEYRALRLLKSAQEAERVYVRKVGFEAPPLDEARRLSGELDEVRSQRRRVTAAPREPPDAVRRALQVAQALELDPAAVPGGFDELMAELLELLARPGAEGAVELDTLDLLRRWTDRPPLRVPARERALLESALWSLLPPPAPAPGRRPADAGERWSGYRRLLGGEPGPR